MQEDTNHAPDRTEPGKDLRSRPVYLLALPVSLVCLFWAYWPVLRDMSDRWASDPQYSHGYLVPAFAAVLLWMRRDRLAGLRLQPSVWGIPLLAAGGALYLAGAYLFVEWFGGHSLLFVLFGLGVLWGGWRVARWAAPAVAFLAFMLPMPFRLET